MKRASIVIALAAIVSACRVGPDHHVPEVQIPAAWTEAAGASVTEPARAWWSAFGDSGLDALVARAAANNLDVQIATTRIREARAVRGAVAGQWDPAVSAGAGFTRNSPSETTAFTQNADAANLFDAVSVAIKAPVAF